VGSAAQDGSKSAQEDIIITRDKKNSRSGATAV